MKPFYIYMFFIFTMFCFCEKKSQTDKPPSKIETYYVQIDNLAPARLLDKPDGVELTRISTGEILKREETKVIEHSALNKVVWHKVSYKSYTGWISEHVTTGIWLKERKYIITEKQGEIPLRDQIGKGHITLSYLPGSKKLEVEDTKKVQDKYLGEITYYKVTYITLTGWIMDKETTGEIITEIR